MVSQHRGEKENQGKKDRDGTREIEYHNKREREPEKEK